MKLIFGVVLVFLSCNCVSWGATSTITFTTVPSSACYVPVVNGVSQGCSALPSYVTGDGAGQTLQTVSFNNGTVNTPTIGPSYSGIFTIDAAGSRTEPQFDATSYLSIAPGNQVVIDFSTPINYFGLDWGSVHAGDTLTINDVVQGSTSTLIQYSFSFTDGLDQYVYANASGVSFNEVVLASASVCCFVTDNHSFISASPAVTTPEPVTRWMLPIGVLAMLVLLASGRAAGTPRPIA